MAARLRSTAAVHGAATALDAYERHRVDLADRLGVDPGPQLQALHAELLAADRPVRAGLRFEATSLVGRDADIRALRAVVREARVTSILGPGGLGKTRLAHLLGREAEQPIVHFIELVGISSPEDVVGEVGSALGVRDSVSGRRVLTAEQLNDVRARIGQALDQAPTLLILDNCEHVIAAVADLVAFLVSTCRRLRVVTTTRAPLAIAAERVFPLGQLSEDAAADLFRQRASAARPGVALDDEAVRRVVRRLDGLPLAIELAAAKVRVMSVGDIDRRLDDRFALLRGGDRSAPDRHQTLVAVIDWSWNLLTERERRALRWLAVFHDGFALPAADELLGHDSLDEIQSLVDQSLLTVLDGEGSVRYRMLETVREFGRMQLVGAGEDREARAAELAWARTYVGRTGADLWTSRQVAAVRELRAEENNLADCLREAVARPDPWTTVQLLSVLGGYWTITGENARIITLASAVEDVLRGWVPTVDQVDIAVAAATVVVLNTMQGRIAPADVCEALVEKYGDQTTDPRVLGIVEVMRAQDLADPAGSIARLDELGRSTRHLSATMALMWAAHFRENAGDPLGAIRAAEQGLALVGPDDGPALAAQLETALASLHAQLGHHRRAAEHARAALPVLDLLEVADDAIQVRSLLAVEAMTSGDLVRADALLGEIERIRTDRPGFGGVMGTGLARAELALVRGQFTDGLRLYRSAVDELHEIRFPGMAENTGMEPWGLFGEAAGLTAYARYGTGDQGSDLYETLRGKVSQVIDGTRPHMDYPVAGVVLYGLGAWGLLRDVLPTEDAVRLLVLADRFGYARFTITMDPQSTLAEAERRLPGLVARLQEEYGDGRGPDLLAEARAVVERSLLS